MKIPIGTQSVLWGVHQFLWHPFTVWLAWIKVYGSLPNWWQTIGIFCHDTFGYWGCTDMDGESGLSHPRGGAFLAARLVGIFSMERAWDVYFFCLNHSSNFARLNGQPISALYLPDKVSILFDPAWFYLFRARLSGELDEYIYRECLKQNLTFTDEEWLNQYRATIRTKLNTHKLHVSKH